MGIPTFFKQYSQFVKRYFIDFIKIIVKYMNSEFSEKEYEVAFTFQFLENNIPSLDGYPFMPSSRIEGSHPFDVRFRLIQENIRYSIFFQFKIANYVELRRRGNSAFFDRLGSPVYYFKIWPRPISDQHNLMCYMRQIGCDIYYVAPGFYKRQDLFQNFKDRMIINNSVFCDPFDIGFINDDERHKVAYNNESPDAYFFSEIAQIKITKTFETLKGQLRQIRIDDNYISKLLSRLIEGINEKSHHKKLFIPKQITKLPLIYQCNYLLMNYYGLKWILF
jgi:hypothetical protein